LYQHHGHFPREDPFSFTAGDTNLYRYVFNEPVSYVDPTGLSWWDKVKSFGRGMWNGFLGVVHEAVLIPVDIVGTSVDTLLGLVDYGFGTNLSFRYEARSYYGRALEDRLRHGDLDGFWDLAGTTAVDLFFLGLPSTYVAIEEAVTEGNLEPLGEVMGGYGGTLAVVYAGRYAGRCTQRVVPRRQPGTAPSARPPKPPGQWDSANYPRPPGWNNDWTWGPPSGDSTVGWRWWDPNGGEWRWHPPDRYHAHGHWDYNPWTEWNSRWRNVPAPADAPPPSAPAPWGG